MTVKEAMEDIKNIEWTCDALEDIYNGNTDPSVRIAFTDAIIYLNQYKALIEKALDKVTIEL